MEKLLYEVGMRVIVVLIATPIVMAITGVTRKTWQRANGSAQPAEPDGSRSPGAPAKGVPWNTLAYAVVYGALMIGIMELSLALSTRLFRIGAEAQWTVGSSVTAWGLYLALSLLAGVLAQGLITASRQSGRGLVERNATQRQMVGSGLWTKLAFLPVYLGWAILAAPGAVYYPMIFGLLTFVIIDVLSVLALLSREHG